VTRRRDTVVVVEVDRPSTILRSIEEDDEVGSRVRGAVALRRRMLQKHGEKIAVINADTWAELEDPKQRQKHMRDVLLRAGVSEDRFV